jgi:hypothetical protein
MRYLAGTLDYGLVIGGTGVTRLASCYSTDGGGDSDRKSTPSSLHFIGNGPVHWSRKHTCVALFTAEAEYMAASSCSQEVL